MLAAHERKLTITHTNHSTMLYLQPMRNQLLILAVVLGIPGPLLAQDREYLSDPDPTCILSTDKETWMSLGLRDGLYGLQEVHEQGSCLTIHH